MQKIMPKVVIYHRTFTDIGRKLRNMISIDVVQSESEESLKEELSDAQFLIVSIDWKDRYLEIAPNLKWIQSISAGIDLFPLEKLKERGIKLTSASGIHRVPASEYALGCILLFSKQLLLARENQITRTWDRYGLTFSNEVKGKTVCIIGLGAIGTEVAKKAKCFGMNVLGVKRDISSSTRYTDRVYPPHDISRVLKLADFVVLSCPLTSQTKRLIGRKEFGLMKETAYLINLSRGQIVVESDLVEAIENKMIAGAALDVFENEPLPRKSKLWDLSNVLVTPHIAGRSAKYSERVAKLFAENYQRLESGKELKNQVL